jgi:uncharacterized protein YjbI with pentapeptide repeats
VANLLAYWSVPAVIFLIWLRYLPRQDMRGTALHILIFSAAVAAATSLPALVSRIIRPGEIRMPIKKSVVRVALWSLRAALAGAMVLLLLSLGVIHGLPADPSVAPEVAAGSPLRWASDVLRLTGLRPYADLTEAALVTPATRRSATEDTTGQTAGPGLNEMELRFARAYRAELPAARMWRANLRGAYLTEADLRGANLREAKLQDAVLDHVRAEHAVFISANGTGANLTTAEGPAPHLNTRTPGAGRSPGEWGAGQRSHQRRRCRRRSMVRLGMSIRGGEHRDDELALARNNGKLQRNFQGYSTSAGASLYGANLRSTQWLRADLTRADVRDTQMQLVNLSFANLELADFSGAKLEGAQFGGAQLKGTIFLGANLEGADLRGANFTEAVLRDAAMTNANIEGTDLRGALGLTAAQICSTRGWHTAQFDPDVAQEIAKSCGAAEK